MIRGGGLFGEIITQGRIVPMPQIWRLFEVADNVTLRAILPRESELLWECHAARFFKHGSKRTCETDVSDEELHEYRESGW